MFWEASLPSNSSSMPTPAPAPAVVLCRLMERLGHTSNTRDNSEDIVIVNTNDRALFAMFARSNLNFQEPGNGDTKLSGKGRGEDTCHMSHVIQVRRKA